LKAKLEEARNAELQSHRSDQKSQLKSYTSRFRRPGESQDRGANSHRNLTERRVTSHGSSASWRKKDSHFIRPDSSEACNEEDRGVVDREQDQAVADGKQHQASRSSETSVSQKQGSKPAESCTYTHVFIACHTCHDYYFLLFF